VEIRSVVRVSTPLNIALLLDATNSTLGNSLEATLVTPSTKRDRVLARAVEEGFVKRLPPDARLRVFGFNEPAEGLDGFDADRVLARRAIDAALALPEDIRGGPSPVWDVAVEAVRSLAAQPPPRALVVFTDGEATGSSRSMADVASMALAAQVSVHVVSAAIDQVIPQLGGSLESRPSEQLKQLARITGGAFLHAPGAEVLYRPYLQYESLSSYRDVRRERRPTWNPDPEKGFAAAAALLPCSYDIDIGPIALSPGLHSLEVSAPRIAARVYAPTHIIVAATAP
jgi:hypothetical protein